VILNMSSFLAQRDIHMHTAPAYIHVYTQRDGLYLVDLKSQSSTYCGSPSPSKKYGGFGFKISSLVWDVCGVCSFLFCCFCCIASKDITVYISLLIIPCPFFVRCL
jgi:hypothetical protein